MNEPASISTPEARTGVVIWAFALETLLAGANGVAIRFSNRELAPVWGAGLRFALASALSLLALLASVLCFAQALVLVRRLPPMQPIVMNAVGMVTGTLVLLGISLLLQESWALPQRRETWVALLYVAAIGSVAVFLLHVFIAQNWGASRAAYVMVAIPLVTIVLSAWLDQEPVTGGLLVGGTFVVAGVYLGALRSLSSAS